jgi:hypothetical protein
LLIAYDGIGDAVQSAKRTLINRFRSDVLTNKFWVEAMSGTQLDVIPAKTLKCISDYEETVSSISIQDIQLLVEVMGFDQEDSQTACIGIASPNPPSSISNKLLSQ